MAEPNTTNVVSDDRTTAPWWREWRVEIAGMPIMVVGEPARDYLEEINRRMAQMKMALHRILAADESVPAHVLRHIAGEAVNVTTDPRELRRMLFDLISGMIDTPAAWPHVGDVCALTPERAQAIVNEAFAFADEKLP